MPRIPTNSRDNNLKYEIKLSSFLNNLFEIPTRRNLLFIDACYSGADRGTSSQHEQVASRGGIKRRYKKGVLRGNTVMFAASSSLEKSNGSKELRHGIFTYNLLLELKKSMGKITLADLSDTLSKNVNITSIKLLGVPQTPTVDYSPQLKEWKEWSVY